MKYATEQKKIGGAVVNWFDGHNFIEIRRSCFVFYLSSFLLEFSFRSVFVGIYKKVYCGENWWWEVGRKSLVCSETWSANMGFKILRWF